MADTMTPRQLDAEIAVKLFGIKPREVRIKGSTNTVTVLSDSPSLCDGVWDEQGLKTYGVPDHYSDWSGLPHVLARLRELGWAYEHRGWYQNGLERFDCRLWMPGDITKSEYEEADTLPLACAKAALAALEASQC